MKHFKFEERGKRRIHKKPNAAEVSACLPWLAAEILAVKPEIVVCLGATAAQALLGRDYRLTKERGTFRSRAAGPKITSTIHPSAVLRAPDEDREAMYEGLVADLRKVAAGNAACEGASSSAVVQLHRYAFRVYFRASQR